MESALDVQLNDKRRMQNCQNTKITDMQNCDWIQRRKRQAVVLTGRMISNFFFLLKIPFNVPMIALS